MYKWVIGIILLGILVVGVYFSAPYWDRARVISFWSGDRAKDSQDINILALGRVAEGQGGRWHAAPGLVDAIVVINYKPKSGIVNLVSLPRDLYAEVGGEKFKINEVYRREKLDEFLDEVSQITGIPTDKYLVVDVGIIETAVDELGGIDVLLENDIIDSVSGFRLSAGQQHIDGEDTVWIMRNRYAGSGDFFRERNQHIVIGGIFNKFNSLSTIEKTKFLLNIVPYTNKTETNFSIGELIPEVSSIGRVQFNSIILGFDTGLLQSSRVPVNASSSAYILVPTEGQDNYNAIREFIASKLLE